MTIRNRGRGELTLRESRRHGPDLHGGLGELPDHLARRSRPPMLGRGAYMGEDAPLMTPQPGTVNPYRSVIYPILASTESVKVLPANPYRAYFLLQNNCGTGDNIFVAFGTGATLTGAIKVIDGGNLIFEGGGIGGSFVPTEDVYIIGDAADLAGVIMEGMATPY